MQYNVAKTRETMDSILNHEDTQEYSLLLLQEHCRTYNQTIPLLHHAWTAIEPTHHTERLPRAAIYMNNEKISTDSIEQILAIPHEDILAISLPYRWTLPRRLLVLFCVKRLGLPAPQRRGSSHSGEGKTVFRIRPWPNVRPAGPWMDIQEMSIQRVLE
jgi:hypothetical protein